MLNRGTEKRTWRGWRIVVPAAAVLLHAGLVLNHYPISLLRGGDVPLRVDMARYFASAHSASQVTGLFGYDPFFMAGYPVGLWNSLGKKGFELFHLLLPRVALPALFYGVLAGVALLAPLAAWYGLRRFWREERHRILLLVLLLTYWHLDTPISYFWMAGNVFFPAMACLVPVAAGLAWDMVAGIRPLRRGLLLGLVAAALFYCHTVVLVALAVPIVLAAWLNRSGLCRAATWFAAGVSALVFGGLCVWWALPLACSIGDCVPQPHPWLQSSWKHLVMDTFSDRGYRHPFDRNLLLHAAVVLGAAGTFLSWNRRRFLSALGVGGIACLGIAYGGSYLGPIACIQPYRFLIPAVLLLLGPMVAGADWAWENMRRASPPMRVVLLAGGLILLPGLSGYLLDRLGEAPAHGMIPSQRQVLDALRQMPVKGRVLCDDMNVGHMIPYTCGLPVIGGLSAQAFLKHRFAGMDNDGLFFAKRSDHCSAADFKTYLHGYGVDYAVFSRSNWIEFAERNADLFERERTAGGYRIYKVKDASPSLVLTGAADVRAGGDRIEVTNVRSESLVLKLHYVPWMAASDGVRLEPEAFLDDPVPFMRATVPAGVTAFRIAKRGSAAGK